LGRARALAPESAAPLLQLGVMAAREQRYDAALDFFEQVLRIEGSSGPAHLFRGKALFALGRMVEALRAFSDAARWLQEPSSDPLREQQLVEAFYNAGVLQLQLSPADALAPLEEALLRDPTGRWTPGLREAIEKLKQDLGRAK
ncbi:MAG: tetratricopeptide repeat protein, partial [Planctomycetota bacterium]